MSACPKSACVRIETSSIREISALPRPTSSGLEVRAATTQYRRPSAEFTTVLSISA